jgi:hypothetical protein
MPLVSSGHEDVRKACTAPHLPELSPPSPAQHLDCCVGSFVFVDLGVGHPRMIIDHGVYECVAELGSWGRLRVTPSVVRRFLLP